MYNLLFQLHRYLEVAVTYVCSVYLNNPAMVRESFSLFWKWFASVVYVSVVRVLKSPDIFVCCPSSLFFKMLCTCHANVEQEIKFNVLCNSNIHHCQHEDSNLHYSTFQPNTRHRCVHEHILNKIYQCTVLTYILSTWFTWLTLPSYVKLLTNLHQFKYWKYVKWLHINDLPLLNIRIWSFLSSRRANSMCTYILWCINS